jgi:cholest-4-en-3-one 26-monooxygenase
MSLSADGSVADLASVDLTDLRYWSDGPPYELFARMRAEAPVRWNPSAHVDGFWSLTRGVDILRVSGDPATFSSGEGGIFLSREALGPLDVMRQMSIFKDGAEHERYRGVVAKAFLPRTMMVLDEVIREAVNKALDRVLAGGPAGGCDLVRDVAMPVPVTVIGKMLGAHEQDAPRLQEWTAQIEEGMTNGESSVSTFEAMGGFFLANMNNDLIPGMECLAKSIGQAEFDGTKLSDVEIATYFGMLLYAGNEPTRSAISAGMLALIENPDQMELLRTQPALLRPNKSGHPPAALGELLRWTAPVGYFARTATQNVSLGGQQIKAGDRVVMWYPAASRDPDMIADPDVFDVTRNASDVFKLAYGGGGPHHCQGWFLSNRMLWLTIQETIKRLGDIELAGEVTRVRSTFANSLTSLPVRFRPAMEPRPAVAQPRGYAPVAPPEPAPAPEARPTARAASPASPAHAAKSSAPAEGKKPGLFKRVFGGK